MLGSFEARRITTSADDSSFGFNVNQAEPPLNRGFWRHSPSRGIYLGSRIKPNSPNPSIIH